MEFNEKLQKLRKQKNITQEELASVLYVSRTAISKWESGRGYPNIESLKAMASFFNVSIDGLLSGEELLIAAEEDSKQKERDLKTQVFGLLDLSVAVLFFLPFFGQGGNGVIEEVSLFFLTEISLWLKMTYFIIIGVTSLFGLLSLVLKKDALKKSEVSLLLNVFGVILFIASNKPYPAIYLFVFLVIKAMLLLKNR